MQIGVLAGAGLAAGFVAGLIGLGGGVVFTPVLLVYFRGLGVSAELAPKLTIGTSLLCTLVAALASAFFQLRRGAVLRRVAWSVGPASAVAVFLMTLLVTTRPWYDATVFQVVFALLLLGVVGRMVLSKKSTSAEEAGSEGERDWSRGRLAGIGAAAGVVASAAGVGGGVVLVPAYNRVVRLPMHEAVGTSSATIVLISLAGIFSYAALGWNAEVPFSTAVGYVDVGRGLLLAVPSVFTARLGVAAAHRIRTRPLQLVFAAVALFVAGRMLYGALGG